MDWEHLFHMQQELDYYIAKKHQLESVALMDKKILALLVEVGELANETRCFKFWSTKAQSEKPIILEEYIDCLHFILSIGLEMNFRYEEKKDINNERPLSDLFNHVFETIIEFKKAMTKKNYQRLFKAFLDLGQALGFKERSIQQAYYDKNKVNYERQEQGY